MSWTIKKKQRLAEGRASQTGGPPQPMGQVRNSFVRSLAHSPHLCTGAVT